PIASRPRRSRERPGARGARIVKSKTGIAEAGMVWERPHSRRAGMPALPPGWDDGNDNVTRLVCPDCGGSLTVQKANGRAAIFFTCRIGHGYGLADVLTAKEHGVEAALWKVVYVLQELTDLLQDLEQQDLDEPSPAACRTRAAQAGAHGERIRA